MSIRFNIEYDDKRDSYFLYGEDEQIEGKTMCSGRIHSPSLIERLRGITIEDKIKIKKQKITQAIEEAKKGDSLARKYKKLWGSTEDLPAPPNKGSGAKNPPDKR